MSMYYTNMWKSEMEKNLPKCPACGGEMEYGFLISKDPIHWAGGIEGNRIDGLGEQMTGPFKKPLGVAMSRCHRCRLMITTYPPSQ